MAKAVGIDSRNNKLSEGSGLTPLRDGVYQRGRTLGRLARRQTVLDPENTIYHANVLSDDDSRRCNPRSRTSYKVVPVLTTRCAS
jgi:hypothetical protein